VTFDSNGNTLTSVTGSNTTSYTWDFENRMTSVTLPGSGGTVSFKYDPFGRRIYKSSSSGTSVYAYDGDNLVEETNATGAVVARYSQTQNIDEPLALLRSGATSYYHADGLGSVTSLSSAAGSIANTYTYDSFGKLTSSTGSLVNPFQYTARESDTETGLYYYRARYYHQSNGRFISEDPIEFDGGKNFYAYVENEPTGFIDPRGLDDTPGWAIPGSATPFPPKGGPAPRRKPYNCLAYAVGKRDQWMQPDRSPADYGLIPYMKQHGCTEVPCDAVEPCGKRHRVNTYQDPLNPLKWHVERQDCDGSWSSKDGQGPLSIGISNPDSYYQRRYGPVFNPKKVCWSCQGN